MPFACSEAHGLTIHVAAYGNSELRIIESELDLLLVTWQWGLISSATSHSFVACGNSKVKGKGKVSPVLN